MYWITRGSQGSRECITITIPRMIYYWLKRDRDFGSENTRGCMPLDRKYSWRQPYNGVYLEAEIHGLPQSSDRLRFSVLGDAGKKAEAG